MVDIKTFKIDGNNRIVVNGIKIMWTTLSELDSIGSNDMTYEQRFRYLVDCRSKGVTPCKIDKNIHDAKTHFAVSHEHIETYRLTFGDTLEALEEYITETVNTLYEKYKAIHNEKVTWCGRCGLYRYMDMDDTIEAEFNIIKEGI